MGKTHRNHPYQKKYDTDVIYRVTVSPSQKHQSHSHSIISEIISETEKKSDCNGPPSFCFGERKSDNVEKISIGKNKNWEKSFDLPVLKTEYYHVTKSTQRVKVPKLSSCGTGECNAYVLYSKKHIKQHVENMNDDEKELLKQTIKKKKEEYKEKKNQAKQNNTYCFAEKPFLEKCIPFDHYKQVVPVQSENILKKELHKTQQTYCDCCLQSSGRIWMLRGNGNKSLCKNKSMKRIKQREINDAISIF